MSYSLFWNYHAVQHYLPSCTPQSLENPALLAEEASDHEEKDDIDEEEAEHIEKELLALFEEDDSSSDDGSEGSVNYDVEDTTNMEQLGKNNQALRTEQVYTPLNTLYINDHFYRCHRMSGSGGI